MSVVDTAKHVVAGQNVRFRLTLKKNGATYNLSGKTVTATIRRESAPQTSLGDGWDDQPVTLQDAANGIVDLVKELDASVFTAPPSPSLHREYLIETYVAEDDYSPDDVARFYVRSAMGAT